MRLPNPYRGLRGLPRDVWILFAATLVSRAGTMALPFLVLYMTSELHVSASAAGLALSAYGVGGVVTAPLAGRLADRVGAIAVMRASLALAGVALLVLPLVRTFAGVVALTFLWATVAEATRPATMSALLESTPAAQRKAAIAANRLAINLGMSVGPAVGGFLAAVSFPLLFVVNGLTSIAAAALLWIAPFPARGDDPPANPPQSQPLIRIRPRATVWHDRPALAFFGTALLVHLVYAQHTGAMPLYLVRELGYRESFYGFLFIINTALIVAIEVPLNLAMAHWPAWKANGLAALLIAAGFGALAIVASPVEIAATVVIWTFGEMIFYPAAAAHAAELAPARRTGEYMGALSAAFALATVVGPWAGTAILDRAGSEVTWGVSFACGVVAAAVLLLARGERTGGR